MPGHREGSEPSGWTGTNAYRRGPPGLGRSAHGYRRHPSRPDGPWPTPPIDLHGGKSGPMDYRVLISDAKAETVDHDAQEKILASFGAETISTMTRDEDELIDRLEGIHGLIVDAAVPVTARVIRAAPALEVIGRAGIGVDNVDLQAAGEQGVTVVHHPTYCIDEVATHALSLLLACLRGTHRFDRATRAGEWDWTIAAPISRLRGATLGVLGFGKVPRRLVTMLQGFGLELLAHDPYVDDEIIRAHNVEPVDFASLCDRSELLSVHASLTPETRGMVDAAAIDRLGEDAILVNTARGPIVDTDALVDALADGQLGGVGLDVTEPEPLPADHPLFEHDRVIVTPHTAWYSDASRQRVSEDIATDVGRVLTGEAPRFEVDLDEPWQPDTEDSV